MRLPDAQKFNLGKISSVTATPWSIHEASQLDGVFVEKKAKAQEDSVENPQARQLYIKQADLDTFGYTPECKKCKSREVSRVRRESLQRWATDRLRDPGE